MAEVVLVDDGVDGSAAETRELDPEAAAPDGIVWVDAAPFRAHLAHVMAVGEMSVEVVAAMTGISARGARHLLHGRAGRPVRRISAATGLRLLRLTSFEARTVRTRLVSARGAGHQIDEILRTGLSLSRLAKRSGVARDRLAALVADRSGVCSPLLAAQVAAVHAALDAGDEVGYPLAS